MATCRMCGTELTEKNTSPAYLKRGFHICRRCRNLEQHRLLLKKNKTKADYAKLLELNALGGLNIKILSHAKTGEPMYLIEEIGFDNTTVSQYEAWGDFIAKLKTIFKRMKR